MRKYNREEAVQYTKTWAYSRNPKYYNFDSVGGDCTSSTSSYDKNKKILIFSTV